MTPEPTWNNHDPEDCIFPDCEDCYITYRYRKFMKEDL